MYEGRHRWAEFTEEDKKKEEGDKEEEALTLHTHGARASDSVIKNAPSPSDAGGVGAGGSGSGERGTRGKSGKAGKNHGPAPAQGQNRQRDKDVTVGNRNKPSFLLLLQKGYDLESISHRDGRLSSYFETQEMIEDTVLILLGFNCSIPIVVDTYNTCKGTNVSSATLNITAAIPSTSANGTTASVDFGLGFASVTDEGFT
ncbi:hypothetical protein F5887DRAFT_1077271 [Amanita rubescens]|nr:hypothetical protein F5887DRAFT_1077271 [Amanita rubescens]